MTGILNCPIANCPITTWQVNKTKITIEEIVIFHDYTDKNTLIITFWLDWVSVASGFAANATGAFSPSIGFAVTTGGPRWTAFTFINTHQA